MNKLYKDTIEHWQENLAIFDGATDFAETPNIYELNNNNCLSTGSNVCPLCIEYLDIDSTSMCCAGCPIAKDTGKDLCQGTPYSNVLWTLRTQEDFEAAKQAVKAELVYLENLLGGGAGQGDSRIGDA